MIDASSARADDPGSHAGVPAWLQGAWIRDRRKVGDDGPRELSDVAWLQVGSWFADFRALRTGSMSPLGLDQSQAFSGHLEVKSPSPHVTQVTWHHDLDTQTRGTREVDTANLALRDNELVERGVDYLEWWRRVESDNAPRAMVLEYSHPSYGDVAIHPRIESRILQIAGVAIAVWGGESPGGFWASAGTEWEPRHSLGGCSSMKNVVSALRAAVSAQSLPDQWTLREVS